MPRKRKKMKSYLLKNLSEEQLGLLINAGVPHYEWDTGGIIIEEAQLNFALAVLGATATESKTEYEGVFKLKLRYSKPEDIERAQAEQRDEEKRQREKAHQESRRRYIKACESRTRSILDAAVSTAQALRKKLSGYKQRFVKSKRDEVLGGKLTDGDAASQNVLAELERIRMVEGVRAVHVVPNRILISTEILCASEPETGFRHEIGQFLITIYLDGSHDGIRWQNNSRRVNGVRENMHAPNVLEDGQGAAAEIHATLLELIARLELSTVAELAIQFIQSPEDNEYAKHIKNWPLV